jgi:CTP synthase (UTP-ammonia lyase)
MRAAIDGLRAACNHLRAVSPSRVKPIADMNRLGPIAPLRIGVIGDFEPAYHSHFATNAALYDAAARLNVRLAVRWLATSVLNTKSRVVILRRYDGLVASPGSPYKSFTGMLAGIEFARTRDWPFVGT